MLYRLSYVGGAAASRFYPVAVATPPHHDVNAHWVDSVRDDLRTGKKRERATSNVALSLLPLSGYGGGPGHRSAGCPLTSGMWLHPPDRWGPVAAAPVR